MEPLNSIMNPELARILELMVGVEGVDTFESMCRYLRANL